MSLTKYILAQPTFSRAIQTAIAGLKALKPTYDWVGVYLLDGDVLTLRDEHYLGPVTEHPRIPLGHGICGAAAADKETIVVDDVNADDRYIACSLSVQSEIVVPILVADRVVGVLDLDSDTPAAFGTEDGRQLEAVAAALAQAWQRERAPAVTSH